MQIYYVSWRYDPKLGKGNGRLKDSDQSFHISVLVRYRSQALDAFEFAFIQKHYNDGIKIEDGTITIERCCVDSRNISCQYLMLDGMSEPLYLTSLDCKHNNFRNIFAIY